MREYIITTDSGCDLSFELCNQRNIIPIFMKYNIDDTEYTDTMDHSKIKDFYDAMRGGKMPRTAQINEAEFTDFWEPYIKEGKDIIHICMSSGISGTYSNGKRAAEELCEKYPECKIEVIDTLMTSSGNGLIVLMCADKRDAGMSFDELAKFLRENTRRVHACFTTDDITYLHRGGRVSTTGMILSKALHICPVMRVNGNGELKVFAKARGKKASWETVANYILDNIENPEEQTLYVSDADNEADVEAFGQEIKEKVGFKDVFYSKIGSIIGAHTGPELLTLFFIGKERKPE